MRPGTLLRWYALKNILKNEIVKILCQFYLVFSFNYYYFANYYIWYIFRASIGVLFNLNLNK